MERIRTIAKFCWQWLSRAADVAQVAPSGIGYLIAGIVFVWGLLTGGYGPYVLTAAILAFGGILWCRNIIRGSTPRHSSVDQVSTQPLAFDPRSIALTSHPLATEEELQASVITRKTVMIYSVPRDTVSRACIRGKIFDDCAIFGPAVVTPYANTVIVGCSTFEDSMIWAIPNTPTYYGAIGIPECTFRNCQFWGVGFCTEPAQIPILRRWLGITSTPQSPQATPPSSTDGQSAEPQPPASS